MVFVSATVTAVPGLSSNVTCTRVRSTVTSTVNGIGAGLSSSLGMSSASVAETEGQAKCPGPGGLNIGDGLNFLKIDARQRPHSIVAKTSRLQHNPIATFEVGFSRPGHPSPIRPDRGSKDAPSVAARCGAAAPAQLGDVGGDAPRSSLMIRLIVFRRQARFPRRRATYMYRTDQ